MNRAYLSLGSSLDKERNLRAGVGLLAEHGRVLAVSSAYETAPIGNPDDPTFLNAALILETPLEPQALKETVLRAVEDRLGRQRTSDPNAPRTFDADISLFNDEILDVGRRHIPDPEILLYAHIAVPLAEIAPNYRHPETGETLAAIARRVSLDTTMIRRDDVSLWR
ncbi:MAG: 2-amino-4-hydroxy-6-hydroxymethyldihydropteridine diphosphokinase [Anaerolineae bacterium]|nr:2-amino-4-hydroxy-6-hydroxymethyldihydropteridine diphosphokinase [Anaerolineae bacterium]MCB0247286.1 2-amino-4-hydroxy-6-hydroxymethyldihydropteridine diphosphokinase [Anaerolineae bacterium]MCB9132897.1 2-amino-4-hydroxy-6-hydroxymethyldihydropteridine diphosphokinase [Anaerolineales bacterium]MCB9141501.1 2-amino-4-hydroxy-6-hydroxymethyldihydropteridine diphosphokinase [Anaerolineales bacterium]